MTAPKNASCNFYRKEVALPGIMAPGAVYANNPIMTSGHPFYLVRMCDYYAQIIRGIDPKLDDRIFVNSLYEQGGLPHPRKYSFDWCFNSLDLSLFDKRTNVFFSLHKGHI
jgi:hypothetical protein